MRFICSNDEHSRCHRLLEVLETAARGGPAGFDVFEDVEALEDHKGFLTVHWRHKPFPDSACLFRTAWALAGEPYENVVHEYPGAEEEPIRVSLGAL